MRHPYNALFVLLLLAATCNCQEPVIEAAYYNPAGEVYRVERKYEVKRGTVLYARHQSGFSIGVFQRRYRKGNWKVVEDQYVRFKQPVSKIDDWIAGETVNTIQNAAGDTVRFYFYKNDALCGDTVFTGQNAAPADIADRLRKIKVKMFLENQIRVDLKNYEVSETVRSYYGPYGIQRTESFDKQGNLVHKLVCRRHKGMVTSFESNPEGIFKTDTVLWLNDSTELLWKTISNGQKQVITRYVMDQDRLSLICSNGVEKQVRYTAVKDVLNSILTEELVYPDEIFHVELMGFERERQKVLTVDGPYGHKRVYSYSRNGQGMILEKTAWYDNKLYNRIVYRYK